MVGEINFGLIDPNAGLKAAATMDVGAAARTQQQLHQQEMQMNQVKLQQLVEDRKALTDLRAKLQASGQNPDPKAYLQSMIASGMPEYVKMGYDGLQKLKEQERFDTWLAQKGMGGAAPAGVSAGVPAVPVTERPSNALAAMVTGGGAAPAPAPAVNNLAGKTPAGVSAADLEQNIMYLSSVNDPRAKALAQRYAEQLKQLETPHVVQGNLVSGTGQTIYTAPDRPTELQRNYEFAKKQGFTGSMFEYERAIKEAGRPPAMPRPEQPPVAVVDPATGKQIYVTREEAIGGRMTPAASMEGLSPKEIQKREAAHPAATAAIKGIEANADTFIKQLEQLRDHPGLGSITGIAAGRLPGVTSAGREAEALYKQIESKGGFALLQSMREASKTGGALGNISNQEGKQLQSAFAAVSRTQDADSVKRAIDSVIEDIKGAKARSREAYDETYAYRAASEVSTPKAGEWSVVH